MVVPFFCYDPCCPLENRLRYPLLFLPKKVKFLRLI